jgi:hypothetical protein
MGRLFTFCDFLLAELAQLIGATFLTVIMCIDLGLK